MDLMHIFKEMDIFAKLIALSLSAGAVASLAVFGERIYAYWRARAATRTFADQARTLVLQRDYKKLLDHTREHPHSPLAWLLQQGTRVYLAALANPGEVSPVELTKRELERKTESVNAQLRRGMGVLSSVGSVAPFVGLLGTVVGIIASFQSIAKEGSGGLGVVSGGISEALVVTALGLLVAIPAVLAFNYLSARADAMMLSIEQGRGEFLDQLEATPHKEQRRAAA